MTGLEQKPDAATGLEQASKAMLVSFEGRGKHRASTSTDICPTPPAHAPAQTPYSKGSAGHSAVAVATMIPAAVQTDVSFAPWELVSYKVGTRPCGNH